MNRPTDPIALVASALGCDPGSLSLEMNLLDHPLWDSLGQLSVMVALEEHYGVAIDEASLQKYVSMPAILEKYEELLKRFAASRS